MDVLASDDGFGRYRFVRALARGGMAELVLAGTTDTADLVVIKRILPALEADADFRRMFEKEIAIARSMAHRNIARTIDAGTVGGSPYIVFEYVHGCDLRRLLAHAVKQHGALAIDVAVAIAKALTEALQYAHEDIGILHRDIDPTNVLVDLDGTVKLVDFGIARKIAVTRTTRASWFKGKAGYVAPEQCLGERVDARTDVFAVGVLLYEMTTGHRLFHGATEYEITNLVLRGQYVRPRDVVPGYPPALEKIVCRALATSPDDRFASARALRAALTRLESERSSRNATKRLAKIVQELAGATPPARTRPFVRGVAIGAPAAALAVLMAHAGARPHAAAPDPRPHVAEPTPVSHATAPAPRRSEPPRAPAASEGAPAIVSATELPPAARTTEPAVRERPVHRRSRRSAVEVEDASQTPTDPEPTVAAEREPRTPPEPAAVAAEPPAPEPSPSARPSLFPPSRTKPWDQLRAEDTTAEKP